MKNLSIVFTAFSLLAMVSCNNAEKHDEAAAASVAKDSAATAEKLETVVPKEPVDSAAMQKAWEAYSTPGDMHKLMAGMNGKWTAEIRFWMSPGAQPTPAEVSTVESRMALGGRYQISEYKGKMMGMPFEGMEQMAFDNAKKKFITTWIDNSGTGMMYMEGPYDEATKTINLTGKMVDPSTGQECDMRQAIKIIDDKNQVMEMYNSKNGKEFKSMEVKLAKK